MIDEACSTAWVSMVSNIKIKANNEKYCMKAIEAYYNTIAVLLEWSELNLVLPQSEKPVLRCQFSSRVSSFYPPKEKRQCIGDGFRSHTERVPDVLLGKR
jgi:hypothetical protein